MKTTLIAFLALGLIIGCSKNPEINEEIEEKPEWNPSAVELDTLTENVKADIGRRFVQHGMTIDSFSLTHNLALLIKKAKATPPSQNLSTKMECLTRWNLR